MGVQGVQFRCAGLGAMLGPTASSTEVPEFRV